MTPIKPSKDTTNGGDENFAELMKTTLEERFDAIWNKQRFEEIGFVYDDLGDMKKWFSQEQLSLIDRIRTEFYRGATKDEVKRRLDEIEKEL